MKEKVVNLGGLEVRCFYQFYYGQICTNNHSKSCECERVGVHSWYTVLDLAGLPKKEKKEQSGKNLSTYSMRRHWLKTKEQWP